MEPIKDYPTYLVINPLHVEMQNAPSRFAYIERKEWWDGTSIKVNNKEKSEEYWVQAWKKELILNYDIIDDKFNEKIKHIKNISDQLNNIKKNLELKKIRKILIE